MNEDFNMSLRKFLKQVGVTSQRAIEDAVRENGTSGKTYKVKAVISIEEVEMQHTVEGEISG